MYTKYTIVADHDVEPEIDVFLTDLVTRHPEQVEVGFAPVTQKMATLEAAGEQDGVDTEDIMDPAAEEAPQEEVPPTPARPASPAMAALAAAPHGELEVEDEPAPRAPRPAAPRAPAQAATPRRPGGQFAPRGGAQAARQAPARRAQAPAGDGSARNSVVYRVVNKNVTLGGVPNLVRMFILNQRRPQSAKQIEEGCRLSRKSAESAIWAARNAGAIESVEVR